MKKVVYAVSRYRKGELIKNTGVGYISGDDLVIACMSKNGKPYIRVFEGCVKNCHPVPEKQDEFRGGYYEIREIEIDSGKDNYEKREIELEYSIWFKYAE